VDAVDDIYMLGWLTGILFCIRFIREMRREVMRGKGNLKDWLDGFGEFREDLRLKSGTWYWLWINEKN